MRRLLSSIGHTHLPSAGGGGARLSPCLLPRRFFSASFPSARSMGLGRCRSSAPARFLMEAKQDGTYNHSWYANRG